ncbi:MAG: VPLPA-CTERM sorting domain-containing protein [Gammaproteobacteria bacterium]|nr:VPLPA-CTERM sorting domain-containing protein [Gammaproteobacteria bacterium]
MNRNAILIASLLASGNAAAITITASQDPNALAGSLLANANTGILVTSASLSGHAETLTFGGLTLSPLTSSGTYTNSTNTYGIGSGVVLSTGGVEGAELQGTPVWPGYGDGDNTTEGNGYPFGTGFDVGGIPDPNDPPPGTPATAAQEGLLDPITGDPATQTFYDHFDVTELVINFDMQSGFDRVSFNIVFGSEEYPEFVESPFIDGFGMFLNGVNIAQVGGKPVNIKHPDMTDTVTGTELDGVLAPNGNPVLTFSGLANPTGNTLRFIVADTSDGIYDTTVYFSALKGINEVPLPAGVWLLGTGVAGLVGRRLLRGRAGAPST